MLFSNYWFVTGLIDSLVHVKKIDFTMTKKKVCIFISWWCNDSIENTFKRHVWRWSMLMDCIIIQISNGYIILHPYEEIMAIFKVTDIFFYI